jgi:hypothetical protein
VTFGSLEHVAQSVELFEQALALDLRARSQLQLRKPRPESGTYRQRYSLAIEIPTDLVAGNACAVSAEYRKMARSGAKRRHFARRLNPPNFPRV